MNLLCERLGIDAPILQAPIGSASGPELVAAVSNAGGLGMLAGTWRSLDQLRADIQSIRAKTGQPFAVNLGVHATPEEKIDLCLAEGVPNISLFWGDGRKYFEGIQKRGAKVIATIGRADEAAGSVDANVDAIIAQSFEAGGHVWGKTRRDELIESVAAVVKDTPIIAAGGIGNPEAAAKAKSLGAHGVCLGTRFVAATESLAHSIYKQKLIEARATDTYYGEVFEVGWTNAPHRVLRNRVVDEFLKVGRQNNDEIIAHASDGTAIHKYSSRLPTEGMTGKIEDMALYAGESVDHCTKIQPAAAIVREFLPAFDQDGG